MLLENRVAIVTGGATGMGRCTAVWFAREGCDVVIADIKMSEANRTMEMVKANGRDGLVVECDISDSAAVCRVVDRTIAKYGKIDILVNAAGGTGSMPAEGGPAPPGVQYITEQKWDRILAVNLKGAFLFCNAVVPHMKERRYGKIVNVSSLGWIHPPVPGPDYHAAKAGVVGLSNDMASELGPWGIHVNCILPGPIRTPFYDRMVAGMTPAEQEAFFLAAGKTTPLQRIGTPEDIAGVALFLASDLSSYVTGAAIAVGGGLPLKPYLGTFG
jgi:NAD(P)-dependent dehydrogenase (short-subunit alcohol dehydrogenase family)